MRKLIDIPKEVVKPLQHICIDDGKDMKNWIQDLIIDEVKKRGGKINFSSQTK